MSTSTRIKLTALGAAAAAAITLGITIPVAASASTPAQSHSHPSAPAAKPTVVLVHGAWADASSFAPVTKELQHDGYTVLNAPNPLRGLASDAANVAAFVNQDTTGPVVLVGHSYGGSVITDAATQTPRVKALVYVDAFAPDQGESTIQLAGAKPGSGLAVPDPSTVLDFVQYPGAESGDVDTYIKPSLFPKLFAAKLPAAQAEELAAEQSPIALSAFTATSSAPAWKTIRSFFFVGTSDKVIPVAEQLAMAKRAGGVIEQGKTDHLAMLEAPKQVTGLIEKAAKVK